MKKDKKKGGDWPASVFIFFFFFLLRKLSQNELLCSCYESVPQSSVYADANPSAREREKEENREIGYGKLAPLYSLAETVKCACLCVNVCVRALGSTGDKKKKKKKGEEQQERKNVKCVLFC